MYFSAISASDAIVIGGDVAANEAGIDGQDCVRFEDPLSARPIAVRLANTEGRRNAAHILLNRRYAWRGYGTGHVIKNSPSHTTFTASSGDDVMGTITLGIDSVNGLAVDTLFKDITDKYRSRPGAKICELTKFAFETDTPSKPMLACLFHLVFIYGHREYGCTDLFIEVVPRHRRFYELMLGFKSLGEVRFNESVSMPVHLLWLDVANIRSHIDTYAGANGKKSRSLYSYFFSPTEEDGLYARMVNSRVTSTSASKFSQGRMIAKMVAALKVRKDRAPTEPSDNPSATHAIQYGVNGCGGPPPIASFDLAPEARQAP